MPRHKSARKRVGTNARDTARNRTVLSQVRAAVRSVDASPKGEGRAEVYAKASSILDRAVRKGVIKKATANRHKSRLARRSIAG